jgi:hypothetical protein
MTRVKNQQKEDNRQAKQKANQEKQKKDLHRPERESKNSLQKFRECRQPQSLPSLAQMLGG